MNFILQSNFALSLNKGCCKRINRFEVSPTKRKSLYGFFIQPTALKIYFTSSLLQITFCPCMNISEPFETRKFNLSTKRKGSLYILHFEQHTIFTLILLSDVLLRSPVKECSKNILVQIIRHFVFNKFIFLKPLKFYHFFRRGFLCFLRLWLLKMESGWNEVDTRSLNTRKYFFSFHIIVYITF